jgi:hypothetical protein
MIELHVKHHADPSEFKKTTAHELLHEPDAPPQIVFSGKQTWKPSRPRTLVVACSDGRLQESVDEFLEGRLGVIDYDRLYSPGGPGALAVGSSDIRTDQLRRELKFLMDAHKIEEIVLLFHGAERTGPEHAVCAHYKRILPGASRRQVAIQQHQDAGEAIGVISEIAPQVKVRVYRAEVRGDTSIHFVDLLRRPYARSYVSG